MANKRELKKYVRNVCGALASEILLARAAFPEIERKDVHDIISDIATLQSSTITKASVCFDKKQSDFENCAEYNKERSKYYHIVFEKLADEFDTAVAAIVKKMNAALPETVRETIKEASAK